MHRTLLFYFTSVTFGVGGVGNALARLVHHSDSMSILYNTHLLPQYSTPTTLHSPPLYPSQAKFTPPSLPLPQAQYDKLSVCLALESLSTGDARPRAQEIPGAPELRFMRAHLSLTSPRSLASGDPCPGPQGVLGTPELRDDQEHDEKDDGVHQDGREGGAEVAELDRLVVPGIWNTGTPQRK